MYKTIENKDKTYTTTGGLKTVLSKNCEYSIYWVKNGHVTLVADIRDHFLDPKGIGNGICRLLNEGKIVLDLK